MSSRSGNRLHALEADRQGQRAVSVNDRWRVCSRFADGDAYHVDVSDSHWDLTTSMPDTRQLKRRPTHSGEMLREDVLPDYGLTVAGRAEALGVSRQSINELLRGRRAVSPEMALRLGRLSGNAAQSLELGAEAVLVETKLLLAQFTLAPDPVAETRHRATPWLHR
jgi:addiction module HigA family antidote